MYNRNKQRHEKNQQYFAGNSSDTINKFGPYKGLVSNLRIAIIGTNDCPV